jgi:hypothetical protein
VINRILTTILSLVVSSGVWAESSTHREHGAHVHGHAALNLAVSDNILQLEFSSPAMNLIGFEHSAESTQDKKRVHDTVKFLQQAKGWISPEPSAGCQLEQADVKSDQLNHDTNHDHGHGHDHHSSSEVQHTDFDVLVTFECSHSERLSSTDLSGLFRRFPGLVKLDVQWITDQSQSAIELNQQQTVIRLD